MDFFKILKGGVGLGMSNFDRLFAEKHGGGAWHLTTLTGTLPLTFQSMGTPLTDYKLYGTSEGAGVETENLFDISSVVPGGWTVTDKGNINPAPNGARVRAPAILPISPEKTYTISVFPKTLRIAILVADENEHVIMDTGWNNTNSQTISGGYGACITIRKQNNRTILPTEVDGITFTEGSTAPASYIPYGYKLPMKVEGEEESTTTPIYIGDSKLMAEEYVDYESGKVYRDIDGVLTPTDPPVALPELSTYQGENTLSCSEGLGEVSITGYIKGE